MAPLTAKDVALVQASFGKLGAQWNACMEKLFISAFNKYPKVKAAFSNAFDNEAKNEDLKGSKKLAAHAANFHGGLIALIENLGDQEMLEVLVYKLAINHVRRQLDPARFEELFAEFVLMMQQDPTNSKEACGAWKKAFGVIANLMAGSMAQIRSQ